MTSEDTALMHEIGHRFDMDAIESGLKTVAAERYLDTIRAQNRRVVVSVEVYDPTGKSSVMRRGATLKEAVKQVREAMDAQTKTP